MPSSILHPTPWAVDYIKPQLHVYRRGRADHLVIPFQISPEAAASLLQENQFLSASRLTFLVHGFRNTIQIPWMSEMKDELLKESDQTVILLDWGNGADLMAARYLQAAANIQSVGAWLANHLAEIGNMKPQLPLWGIGHSLGCHLLGLAGRQSGRLERIAAMDPAGPGFEKHEFLPYRLCSTDAKMVDVIHTDGYDSFLDPEDWISPVNHYGTLIPLGTIDFYPNYGWDQPGAGPVSSHLLAASHLRAIDLFLWSIGNPERFGTNKVLDGTPAFEFPVTKVREVDTPAEMGYHAYRSSAREGNYYIGTTKSEPWIPGNSDIQPAMPSSTPNGLLHDKEKENMEHEREEENSQTDSTGYCIIS